MPRDDLNDAGEAGEGQEERSCKGVNTDGTPCGALPQFVDPETGLCRSHDPEKRDQLREQAQKGGETTARRHHGRGGLIEEDLPPLDSHEAAETWTDRIGRAAATGRISAGAANAALRAVKEWREAHDQGAVSDRLDALMGALETWRETGDESPVLDVIEGGKP